MVRNADKPELDHVVALYGTTNGSSAGIWTAVDQGIFRHYGLTVDPEYAQGSIGEPGDGVVRHLRDSASAMAESAVSSRTQTANWKTSRSTACLLTGRPARIRSGLGWRRCWGLRAAAGGWHSRCYPHCPEPGAWGPSADNPLVGGLRGRLDGGRQRRG